MNEAKGYLERLNDKQREAALHKEGPLLILAGAGSGKTSTMTCRIAHLIEEGVSPYNILAVTFTNKAAREMRERVETLMEEISGNGILKPDISSMWIQTFHSACLRILRVNAERLGYIISDFVYSLSDRRQFIFMSRYYVADSIDAIARDLSLSRSMVNKELAIIRSALKEKLESEGYLI